jgi:ubiquinone/menaquinone biosynthesis C-methylase UbiE
MTLREDLLQSPAFTLDDNLFFQKSQKRNQSFEKNYIALRTQEQRVYSDDVVKQLPKISSTHPLKNEWRIRKRSTEKLKEHLLSSPQSKKILEVGCGNGWLSYHLSNLPGKEVIGLDLNETELRQAVSVFGEQKNLSFIYADIFTLTLLSKFDTIILASSVQYFEDLHALILKLFDLLTDDGEIHIIDSPFYKLSELQSARSRTEAYFSKFNLSGSFYFHHAWPSLEAFQSEILHDPKSIFNQLKMKVVKNVSPFPWIRIKK